jgi:hypothetical protein
MAPLLVREPSSVCLIGAARAAFDGTTRGENEASQAGEAEMSGWATSARPSGHKLRHYKARRSRRRHRELVPHQEEHDDR